MIRSNNITYQQPECMNRPKIHIKLTWLDWLIEALSFASVLAAGLLWVVSFAHNAIVGVNTTALLFVVSITTYTGMTVLSRFPRLFNFPVEVTQQNAHMLYKVGIRMIRVIKFIITLMILYMCWYKYMNPHSGTDPHNTHFIVIIMGFIAATMLTSIMGFVMLVKKTK